jgi:hypothetical protein
MKEFFVGRKVRCHKGTLWKICGGQNPKFAEAVADVTL